MCVVISAASDVCTASVRALDDLIYDGRLETTLALWQAYLEANNALIDALGAAADVTCALSEGASLTELYERIRDTGLFTATTRVRRFVLERYVLSKNALMQRCRQSAWLRCVAQNVIDIQFCLVSVKLGKCLH